ncbi:MAG: 2-hydroxychromene-2-carboxylate isomerase [Hyphomicrobiaceae bacterium]|nr:MAG: 2-hydroxychromene-2-carboxylate isomerase [Hyphomicrobiaceae bacterium]
MPNLQFWYEFASTYSYLSAMRIEPLAAAAGVSIEYRPFLLGPIFHAQGWNTSPFNIYPAKGRYMARDIARMAEERGIPFAMPPGFPQNSLMAARVALVGCDEGWVAPFTRAVFSAQFAEGAQIADRQVLQRIVRNLDLDFERILSAIEAPDIKDRLKRQTAEAQALGLFGAPSFVTSLGEVFWGDDRLEQALAWARRS